MKVWTKVWQCIRKPWIVPDEDELNPLLDDREIIKQASEDVAAARNIYSNLDDPEMADWAVYSLTAAEERYNYLLKKYRQKNRTLSL